MAERNREGWTIPDVIDPPESMRVEICIPKNVVHMKAFWGALWELTFWNNWEANPEHEGALVADVWYRYWLSWERDMNDLLDCEGNMAKCCVEPVVIRRYDPDTGRPQVSYDGGETWSNDPNDIQNQIVLQPPLVTEGGSKTKCDAATNCSEHVNELITATGTNLSTAADVFTLAVGIAEAVLALFLILVSAGTLAAPVTAVATAIWAAATSLFALGIDAYNTYWTVDKQDEILCAIYCNIGENGQFTESQYQSFRERVKANLPASPALDIVMTAINAGGATGMSQMASYGNAADSDCASCDCVEATVYVWDEIADHVTPLLPDGEGVYTAPSGVAQSGGYYVCSIMFHNSLPIPEHWKCYGITVIDNPTFTEPIKYRCTDYVQDALSTCSAQFTFRQTSEPFSITFTLDALCGEH